VAEEHADGRRFEFGYDSAGNLIRELELAPGGEASITSYAYDPSFNKLVRKEADGVISGWKIDAADGDLLERRDADGKTTTWHYDPEGCLRQEIGPEGTTRYSRPDTFCNPTEIRASDGGVRRLRYDSRGRLIDETETTPR